MKDTIIIHKEEELDKPLNEVFVSYVKNPGNNENLLPSSSSETKKFENHPSICDCSTFSVKEIDKTF